MKKIKWRTENRSWKQLTTAEKNFYCFLGLEGNGGSGFVFCWLLGIYMLTALVREKKKKVK